MNFADLQNAGWIAADATDDARHLLAGEAADVEKTPWIARIVLGLGAWLAGIFLTGFIAVALDFSGDMKPVMTAIGLLIIAASVYLTRLERGIFVEQLALAWSFAGYVTFLFGIHDWGQSYLSAPFAAVLVLCPLVYWLSGNAVQRFLSVAWVWLLWPLNAGEQDSGPLLFAGILVSLAVVLAGLSGWRPEPVWRPGVGASIAGLLGLLWTLSNEFYWIADPSIQAYLRPVGVIVALGFAGLLWFLIRPPDRGASSWLIAFTLVLTAIGLAGAAGVAASLGLMAVARSRNNRGIEWFALGALVLFLIDFYYFLGISLMTKSFWMMGIGVLLLVFRAVVFRARAEKPKTSPASHRVES